METKMEKKLPDASTIIEQLEWRYAVKSFDPEKKLSEGDWAAIERAAILAPTSYGLQPFKFIVITDPEMREKLKPACFNQPQITDASHLLIFAAKKELTPGDIEEFAELIIATRGTPREMLEDYIAAMMGTQKKLETTGTATTWSQRQAYIALGFVLHTAAMLGVDACPMEGFDPAKVDEVLGLEDHTATVLCTLGYRADDDWLADLAKVRFPAEKLVKRI